MRYLYTVIIIAIGWFMLATMMTFIDESRHMALYYLAIAHTFVMMMIGFRSV